MPIHSFNPGSDERAGWEPGTAAGHSLLRAFVLNWTAGIASHTAQHGGTLVTRDDLAAADIGRPSFGGNIATLIAPLLQEDTAGVLGTLDAFYGFSAPTGADRGAVFLFSPWPTPDLRPHGWSIMGYGPLMLRPRGGEVPPPPPGLRIERVTGAAGLRDFETAITRGFGAADTAAADDASPSPPVPRSLWTVFAPGVLDDPREHIWVGYEGDRPVCAASAFVEAGIVDVTLVATVPEARRRGFGAAVTWRATMADPDRHALLIATPEGEPAYRSMGYLPLFSFTIWTRERPARPG